MNASEKEYLKARLFDSIRQVLNRNVPKFVGFLDEWGAAVGVQAAKNSRVRYMLYGGYEGAERVFFGAFPDWCEPLPEQFPVVKLKIVNKGNRILSHRDILGALMSQGIERDTVGDILLNEKNSIAFVSATVAEHIIANVSKIADCGVEIMVDESDYLPWSNSFTELTDTVASLRIDCAVAAIAGVSRGKATEFIESGMVAVNGLEMIKVSREISVGDVLTIRKKGRFIIDNAEDVTKKGRIVLKYRKYN